MRRTPVVLALALALGLSGCAAKVVGSPVAAGGATSAPSTTASGKPSASGKPTSSGTAKPSATSAAPSGTQSTGKVKIGTRKKSTGPDACGLVTPEDAKVAVGAARVGEPGCILSTEEPYVVVLVLVTFSDFEGQAREFEIGGNTAYEIKDDADCSVIVMLTDDPDEITPALKVDVTPVDEGLDTCKIAVALATKGFERLPNA
ncbi:hypothetical protein F4559_004984 [Saccharothrix violaceirubra]|uniref:DUF3558 domain-containing protein n=2 Tax=Saccharothrix violaceirubra TaxID=413306 RepID=A0A7W7WXQ9_9PSEU|nr:hypothetical protein [Saccharothrix violaceirubra]